MKKLVLFMIFVIFAAYGFAQSGKNATHTVATNAATFTQPVAIGDFIYQTTSRLTYVSKVNIGVSAKKNLTWLLADATRYTTTLYPSSSVSATTLAATTATITTATMTNATVGTTLTLPGGTTATKTSGNGNSVTTTGSWYIGNGNDTLTTSKGILTGAAPLVFTSTAITKGLDFSSAKLVGGSNNALFSYGTWGGTVNLTALAGHCYPIMMNVRLAKSASYNAGLMRLRFDVGTVDTSCVLTPVYPIACRNAFYGADIDSYAGLGVSANVAANTTVTGDFLPAIFKIEGAGNITTSNHVNVLEATKEGAGSGVLNVAHFTHNGTGGTIVNVLKAENIIGTTTSLINATRTAGTVTNGLKLTGTMTNDINLQNAETINNGTDGVVAISGYVQGTSFNFCPAAGVGGTAASAVALDYTPDLPTLAAGTTVMFIAEGVNTTTLTIAIDGGTAKNLYEQEPGVAPNALDGSELAIGTMVIAVYDGTQFVMISPTGNH